MQENNAVLDITVLYVYNLQIKNCNIIVVINNLHTLDLEFITQAVTSENNRV